MVDQQQLRHFSLQSWWNVMAVKNSTYYGHHHAALFGSNIADMEANSVWYSAFLMTIRTYSVILLFHDDELLSWRTTMINSLQNFLSGWKNTVIRHFHCGNDCHNHHDFPDWLPNTVMIPLNRFRYRCSRTVTWTTSFVSIVRRCRCEEQLLPRSSSRSIVRLKLLLSRQIQFVTALPDRLSLNLMVYDQLRWSSALSSMQLRSCFQKPNGCFEPHCLFLSKSSL